MALTYKLIAGFETGAGSAGDGWTDTGGGGVSESTIVNTTSGGAYSGKYNYNGATERKSRSTVAGVGAGGNRVKFHIRIDVSSNPTSTHTETICQLLDGSLVIKCKLQAVTTTGGAVTLQVTNETAGTTPISGVSFSTGVWHTIQLKHHNSTTVGIIELIVDGGTPSTSSGVNTGTTGASYVDIGVIAPTNNGGNINYYFDDVVIANTSTSGDGHVDAGAVVICRQGKSGAPTYNTWTKSSGSDAYSLWSDTPTSGTSNCVSPGTGDPLKQTMLVSAFDATQTGHGTGTIGSTDTILCASFIISALRSGGGGRTFENLARYNSTDTLTSAALTTGALYYLAYFTSNYVLASPTLTLLNASELGGNKSGGAGGQSMTINDAWVMVAFIPTVGTTYSHSGGSVTGTRGATTFGFLAVAKGVSQERSLAGTSQMLYANAKGVSNERTLASTNQNITALAKGASVVNTRSQSLGGLIYAYGGVSNENTISSTLQQLVSPYKGASVSTSGQSTYQSLLAVSKGSSVVNNESAANALLYATSKGVSNNGNVSGSKNNLIALSKGASLNTSQAKVLGGLINAVSGATITLTRQSVNQLLLATSQGASKTGNDQKTGSLLFALSKGVSTVRTLQGVTPQLYAISKGSSVNQSTAQAVGGLFLYASGSSVERSLASSLYGMLRTASSASVTGNRASTNQMLIATSKGSSITMNEAVGRFISILNAKGVSLERSNVAVIPVSLISASGTSVTNNKQSVIPAFILQAIGSGREGSVSGSGSTVIVLASGESITASFASGKWQTDSLHEHGGASYTVSFAGAKAFVFSAGQGGEIINLTSIFPRFLLDGELTRHGLDGAMRQENIPNADHIVYNLDGEMRR